MIDTPALPPELSTEEAQLGSGSYVFRDEAILGTRMLINLVARNYSDAQAAASSVRHEIDRLNSIFNSRSSGSELSQLNRSRIHRASPALFAVVAAAEHWRTATRGAFSGRIGRAIDLWNQAKADRHTPSRIELARLAREAEEAQVRLDPTTLTILRPDEVVFALDAIAKGWIVDSAFAVARSSPGVFGALIDIGGDIRCGGRSPNSQGWCIGIPDARIAVDNAPLLTTVLLSNHAVTTSGRGPRDCIIDGARYSATLSPRDGWPVEHTVSVTAVTTSAADADALATALLVMPKDEAIAFADQHNVTAQIQTHEEVVWTHSSKSQIQFVVAKTRRAKTNTLANTSLGNTWPKDWQALITFTAPPRQLVRDQHFRSPFMAMWITDVDNNPIRTLLLVGRDSDWQKDNFIWWSMHKSDAEKMVATRSMSTAGSGIYKILWDGTDDEGKELPGGTYVLHVETSRERGKHSHRSLTLDFSTGKQFTDELTSTEEAGGVYVSFQHI